MSNVVCPFCHSEFDPETKKGKYPADPPKETETPPAPPASEPKPKERKGGLGDWLDPF